MTDRLGDLQRQLADQGLVVAAQVDAAVEAVFAGDAQRARDVVDGDEPIDRNDVEIERRAVRLLTDAVGGELKLDDHAVRMIFTAVKVNNELERIGDCAVNIADQVDPAFIDLPTALPAKFRVMANSVIGIMETANMAFADMDEKAARIVLASDDATEAFKDAILQDVEEQLTRGEQRVNVAFALRSVTVNLGRVCDHCTNIAEQVIYVTTGKIVRHMGHKWSDPEEPGVSEPR